MKIFKVYVDLFSRDQSNHDSIYPTHDELFDSFEKISDEPVLRLENERLLDKRSSNPNSIRIYLDNIFVGNVCQSQSRAIKMIMDGEELMRSCKVVTYSLKHKTPWLGVTFVEASKIERT